MTFTLATDTINSVMSYAIQNIFKFEGQDSEEMAWDAVVAWLTKLRLLEGVQSDNVKLSKLAWQEDQNRRRVDYDESVSQTLQVFFHSSNIINALKQKFNLKDLRPNTTDIWFDWEGYQITPHLDGDYQISLQIYLNNQQQPPTVFMDKVGEQYKVFDSATYRSNCGYALLTEGPAYHAMEGPVESGERKSVFARFE